MSYSYINIFAIVVSILLVGLLITLIVVINGANKEIKKIEPVLESYKPIVSSFESSLNTLNTSLNGLKSTLSFGGGDSGSAKGGSGPLSALNSLKKLI